MSQDDMTWKEAAHITGWDTVLTGGPPSVSAVQPGPPLTEDLRFIGTRRRCARCSEKSPMWWIPDYGWNPVPEEYARRHLCFACYVIVTRPAPEGGEDAALVEAMREAIEGAEADEEAALLRDDFDFHRGMDRGEYAARKVIAAYRAHAGPVPDAPVVRLVRQKHQRGCGIACVAMLTGEDYDALAAGVEWMDDRGVQIPSDFFSDTELKRRGFGLYRVYERGSTTWPPPPFARVHLCNVDYVADAPVMHCVVMLADGTVLDPMHDEPRRLSDYPRVYNVAAVVASGEAALRATGQAGAGEP